MDSDEKLNNALGKGEIIRWRGAPQPYGLFDESRKPSTVMSLCWALGWGIVSVGGYYALCVSNGAEIKTGVIVFLLAISLIIVWMPISDKGKIKKLSYAVTDKRVIVVSMENDNPIAMNIADIDEMRVEKGDNGNCHVRVGSPAFKTPSRKLPGLAYRGEFIEQDNNRVYKGLVLFNVSSDGGKTLCDVLKPAISAAKQ